MQPSISSWLGRMNIHRTNNDGSVSNINYENIFLSLKNVSYGYTPHKPVIESVNLQIPKGRFVGLLGPNGSGKSTLLKIIAGIYKPWSGSVEYINTQYNNDKANRQTDNLLNEHNNYDDDNESYLDSYHKLPKKGLKQVIIGYVPQIETVDWNFPVTVKEVVGMGLWDKSGKIPFLSKNIVDEVDRVLDSLGILGHEFERRQIHELSGGEQQRVFLARALIRKPTILVLDEPTSGVDHNTREKILSILTSLSSSGMTIIMTTHDLSGIGRRLPWAVCMNKRVIAEGHPSEVLTETNVLKTYGLVDNMDNDTGITAE